MKTRHFLMGIALTIGLLTACNKNEAPVADALADGEVAFGLSPESAFFDASTVETKAVAATGITSFKAAVTQGAAGSETNSAPCWNNVVFTSDGAGTPTYTASPKKYWPLTNPSYNVYAVAATSDAASAVAAAAPDMVFAAAGTTISMAAGFDKDVVCAYEPIADITYKAKNNLAFSHIFARISTVKVIALNPVAISNVTIQLVNTKTGGTYNLRTGHGQNNGTGWSSLLPADGAYQTLYTNAGSIATGASHTGSDNDYYVVPGSYYLRATWTASVDDYSQTYTNKQSTGTVQILGGYINAIECKLSGDPTEMTFSVSLSEWGSNTIAGVEFEHTPPPPPAYLPGEFSVSSTKKVHFAKGNLQAVIGGGPTNTYNYTASEWKFAEHQWDYIGNAAGNNSFAVGTTVDLFGWVGTTASYDSYGLCTNNSANNAYYGTSGSDALKTDWGSIPGIVSAYGDGWYTLSTEEWNYLFTQRTNASSLYGHCQIAIASGTVTGMLILPDNWTKPSNCTVTPGTGAFNRVTYSATAASGASNAWCDMEAAGAVFLPAAGYRSGVSVYNVESHGYYWPSSVDNEYCAYYVYFNSGYLYPQNSITRYYGFSVRLVN